ncbi:hypothetical protein HBN50_04120 [Halobacteriovorax sp. GB3]|uniref:hypothetical protein n=1 Tax=Halobacteriovorax sp. GB3 TaxID=2719615 RepID=UPI002362F817|nr:hypothetical protein [Halobacteriovorax sp. GB3]MDD0852267.1 hypothetical protein [Halobacteriovorax sp. GB3]
MKKSVALLTLLFASHAMALPYGEDWIISVNNNRMSAKDLIKCSEHESVADQAKKIIQDLGQFDCSIREKDPAKFCDCVSASYTEEDLENADKYRKDYHHAFKTSRYLYNNKDRKEDIKRVMNELFVLDQFLLKNKRKTCFSGVKEIDVFKSSPVLLSILNNSYESFNEEGIRLNKRNYSPVIEVIEQGFSEDYFLPAENQLTIQNAYFTGTTDKSFRDKIALEATDADCSRLVSEVLNITTEVKDSPHALSIDDMTAKLAFNKELREDVLSSFEQFDQFLKENGFNDSTSRLTDVLFCESFKTQKAIVDEVKNIAMRTGGRIADKTEATMTRVGKLRKEYEQNLKEANKLNALVLALSSEERIVKQDIEAIEKKLQSGTQYSPYIEDSLNSLKDSLTRIQNSLADKKKKMMSYSESAVKNRGELRDLEYDLKRKLGLTEDQVKAFVTVRTSRVRSFQNAEGSSLASGEESQSITADPIVAGIEAAKYKEIVEDIYVVGKGNYSITTSGAGGFKNDVETVTEVNLGESESRNESMSKSKVSQVVEEAPSYTPPVDVAPVQENVQWFDPVAVNAENYPGLDPVSQVMNNVQTDIRDSREASSIIDSDLKNELKEIQKEVVKGLQSGESSNDNINERFLKALEKSNKQIELLEKKLTNLEKEKKELEEIKKEPLVQNNKTKTASSKSESSSGSPFASALSSKSNANTQSEARYSEPSSSTVSSINSQASAPSSIQSSQGRSSSSISGPSTSFSGSSSSGSVAGIRTGGALNFTIKEVSGNETQNIGVSQIATADSGFYQWPESRQQEYLNGLVGNKEFVIVKLPDGKVVKLEGKKRMESRAIVESLISSEIKSTNNDIDRAKARHIRLKELMKKTYSLK